VRQIYILYFVVLGRFSRFDITLLLVHVLPKSMKFVFLTIHRVSGCSIELDIRDSMNLIPPKYYFNFSI